jgi:hypothetical protein
MVCRRGFRCGRCKYITVFGYGNHRHNLFCEAGPPDHSSELAFLIMFCKGPHFLKKAILQFYVMVTTTQEFIPMGWSAKPFRGTPKYFGIHRDTGTWGHPGAPWGYPGCPGVPRSTSGYITDLGIPRDTSGYPGVGYFGIPRGISG